MPQTHRSARDRWLGLRPFDWGRSGSFHFVLSNGRLDLPYARWRPGFARLARRTLLSGFTLLGKFAFFAVRTGFP